MKILRKTKIICTIGPATDDDKVLREMMLAGMNVARFNFSHGEYETHEARFNQVVRVREELGLPVATLMDTKGPEVRIGRFINNEPIFLKHGDTFTLTTKEIEGTKEIVSVTHAGLPSDVAVGARLLLDDGAIELKVTKISGPEVTCSVLSGGKLSNNKGVNLPGVDLSLPYLSERDMSDLEFAARMKYDFIAASFVRSAADVNYLRKFIKSLGWTTPRIIAKIENRDGVNNIDEIISAADGIMVARGDLGVEIPFEELPAIQKAIIHKVYTAGKSVVTATQMLESMIEHVRPTRAETTDVANAVYDGTSAVMLSGETAAGNHPDEAVRAMARIAETTEKNIDYIANHAKRVAEAKKNVTNAISHAAVTTAHDLRAKAIITVTKSGSTARNLSKYRPSCPIISCTPSEIALRQLSISWGVVPLLIDEKKDTDELFDCAVHASVTEGLMVAGDVAVITAGIPLGIAGNTNMLKVETLLMDSVKLVAMR
jgi:pyruvate kinase